MAERIKGLQIDLSMQDMGIGSTLAGIRRSFRQLNSDLKLSSNNFKYSEKSMTSYKNRIRELDAATKQQRNNVKELRNQYMQTAKEQGANSAKAVRLRTEYNKQADTLNRLEHELDQTVDGFKRFQKEAQEAARVSNSSFGRLGQKFTDIGPKLTSVGESMKNVGRSMSMYVTAPIVAGFGLAAKKSIDFDDSMRKVKATSGATGGEFQQLRDKALEMGAKTKFSASESAEALNYMALAGWDTKDMLGGIDGVMQLAAASGEDLGAVSDIVTDSLTAFGMKAKDSGRFADVLAQTSSKANTDVRGLGEAFKYAAPVAGALGYTVEDTSIAIGLMSNAGIKGEKAGTALRTMFTNLAKPTKAMKEEMDRLGISITDSNGKMLPMRDVMGQLRNKFKGLSKDQQASAAATIFGKEAMSGALAVINASDEDYKKLTKSIDNSTGASKRMSDEMEGGIGGSIRKMKSAIESMAISIGDVLAPHIRKAADFLAMLADKFTNMPGWVKTGVVGLGIFAAALGPLILTTGAFTAALGSIMTTIGPVMTDITKAGGLMNFLGTKAPFAAKGLTLVGGAFKFMLGPVGLAIAAIAGIGTAFVVAYKKSETFRNIVNTVVTPIKNAFIGLGNVIKQFFSAIGAVMNNNSGKGLNILKKILPDEAAKQFYATLLMVRGAYNDFVNFIKTTSTIIGAFFKTFWKQNGDFIIMVFTTIKIAIGSILNSLFNGVIKPILSSIKAFFSITFGGIKQIVINVFTSLREIVQGGLNVIRGVIKIFKGLFTGDFKLLWEGVKQVFSGYLLIISGILRSTLGNMVVIVKTIGQLIINSFRTIWTIVKNVTLGIIKVLVATIKFLFTGLKNIIVAILNGIKNISIAIWTSIKNSVLAIIRNFVTLSKHNFTVLKGFLSALWISIKNTAIKLWIALKNGVLAIIRTLVSTARNTLNTLKNFITRLWQSIKAISIRIWTAIKNGVINAIKGMYNGVRKILANLKAFITRTWTAIKNTTIKLAKSLSNGVKNAFNSLSKVTRNIFNKLKNFMSNIWRNIKNTTVRLAKSLWSGVKGTWNSLSNGTRNIFNKVKSFMSNTWRSIKNTTVNMAKGLWNGVKNVFNNMSKGLKKIIGKIKGHITGMVSAVKKSLNALIKAVNWVGGKLGIDSKIPKLSTGTEGVSSQSFVSNGAINRPTLATLNDKGRGNGTGSNGHQELVQRKNGSIIAPIGKDVIFPLDKGDKVISGRNTQKLRNQGFIPKFSRGTDSGEDVRKRMLREAKKHKKHKHPTFDAGEMMRQGGFGAGGAGGAAKEAWKYVTDKTKDIGSGAKHTVKSLSDGAKKMINTTKGALGAAGTWAKEKAGDLLQYIGSPGKLVNKVLKEFGVDFSMVNGEIPKMLWDAMWKQLKEGVKSLFGGWLDDVSGGDGDGRFIKYLDNITTRYSPNGPPPGYPFNWAHPGIDLPYIYEKVLTPMGGKVETRHTASGFGKHVIVRAKPYDAYFGHLSKWLVKNGQRVKPGDAIGISGDTGSSSGPHLHYEMNKHGFGSMTGHSIDPVKWLKSHNGSKSVSKSASAWKPDIRRAAKAIGVRVSNADVNDVARLIQTESSGNAGVTQGIKDVNSGGNEAQGLLQYTPGSFNSYAIKGHRNIKNGYDQLLAFFNNTDWRANLSYWKRRMASGLTGWGPTGRRKKFATGGLIKNAGWYNIAEGGYPEWIIPTDPSRNSDAMKLLALAAQDIDGKNQRNKRPNSLPRPHGSNDDDVLLQMLQAQQQQITLLTQIVASNNAIADKDFNPTIDKYTHEQQVFNSIDKYNRQKQRKSRFKPGEVT
ncbi:phage tail tape measure protein [Staphylococcus sp. HMSC070D05]|uniref:phage tail tape measure protein n=2 Tax=Bacillota TaxID=1239 RepID=UPI0008A38617|nr:phage tail tape measure protein [Staphylococcus sp. HMSC070D05]OFO41736.1 hypothetical protein HMPREF3046_01865 [Staphylococcus sp. HMSC070D05]